MRHEIEFIPDRLNQRPVIVFGMNDRELRYTFLVSLVFFSLLMTLIGLIVGFPSGIHMVMFGLMGVVAGFIPAMGVTYIAGKVLARLRRGKPEGYHVQLIIAWLEDHGIKRHKSMIRKSQVWSIHRSQ